METAWLAALLIIPLFVDSGQDRPHTGAKFYAFLGIVSVLAAAWLARELLSGFDGFGKFVRQPLVACALGLVAAQSVSTIFSVAPYISFWGDSRSQGLIYYLGLTVVLLAVARTDDLERRERMYWVLYGGSVLVALAALYAWFVHGGMDDRIGATIGNPNLLGLYLLFGLFVGSRFMVRYNWRDHSYALIPIALGFVVAGSKAPALGLVSALFVIGLIRYKDKFAWSKMRVAIAGGLAAIILFSIPVIVEGAAYTANPFKHSRIQAVAASWLDRVEIWQHVIATAEHTPKSILIGHGPESLQRVVGRWRENEFSPGRALDRAHNVPLHVFMETGLAGLAFYLAVWTIAVLMAYRQKRHWILGLLVAVFVARLFSFSSTPEDVALYAILGTLLVSGRTKQPRTKAIFAPLATALLIVGIVAAIAVPAPMIRAARYAHAGDVAATQGIYPAAVATYREALKIERYDADRWGRLGKIYHDWYLAGGDINNLHRSRFCIDKAISLDPLNPRVMNREQP